MNSIAACTAFSSSFFLPLPHDGKSSHALLCLNRHVLPLAGTGVSAAAEATPVPARKVIP